MVIAPKMNSSTKAILEWSLDSHTVILLKRVFRSYWVFPRSDEVNVFWLTCKWISERLVFDKIISEVWLSERDEVFAPETEMVSEWSCPDVENGTVLTSEQDATRNENTFNRYNSDYAKWKWTRV